MAEKTLKGFGEDQTMNDSFNKIGGQLSAARKERGMRLIDVARELRISADYLKLLESGDFDQLPAPTYVSGFLRTYGKFLELDGADLAGRFYAIQGAASSKMDYKLPVTAGPPQRSAPAVASLFVVLALVGYGGWYWVSGHTTSDANIKSESVVIEIDRKQPGQVVENANGQKLETAAGVTSVVAPADKDKTALMSQEVAKKIATVTEAGDDAATAFDISIASAVRTKSLASLSTDKNSLAHNDAANIAASAVTDDNLENQSLNNVGNRENVNDAAVASEMVQQAALLGSAAVATSRDPDQEVTIRATATSWIEIVRGDGTAVLRKLMKTGETFVVDDGSALYLSTGNAGGIELITTGSDIIKIGTIGEVVRDLPLAKNRLRERF